jgi:hypothetical protein
MAIPSKPLWFGKKRVGVGIRPIHAIGWILTALLVVAIIVGMHVIVGSGYASEGVTIIVGAVILYSLIVALTFDKTS